MAATLYEVLGVAPDASSGALRAAHRDRARRLHPDVASGDAAAMRALNEAWAVLSDPHRRGAYDRTLRASAAAGGPEEAPDGPEAIDEPGPRPGFRIRVRLWPFLVLGAVLLVVLTAYAGRPGDLSTQAEPVGQCLIEGGLIEGGLIEGADLDRTEPCRSRGGRRIVAVGGPGVQCPSATDRRPLRGDPERRTVCISRVAGR